MKMERLLSATLAAALIAAPALFALAQYSETTVVVMPKEPQIRVNKNGKKLRKWHGRDHMAGSEPALRPDVRPGQGRMGTLILLY